MPTLAIRRVARTMWCWCRPSTTGVRCFRGFTSCARQPLFATNPSEFGGRDVRAMKYVVRCNPFRSWVAGSGSLLDRLGQSLGRFVRDRSGQALVEAALVFPMLISVFLGVSEFSQAFTVKRRLEAAANTAADLVARTQAIATADLTGIKAMIDEMLKPYPTATLGLTISSVVADQDNATRVAWSYAQGSGATARTPGASV